MLLHVSSNLKAKPFAALKLNDKPFYTGAGSQALTAAGFTTLSSWSAGMEPGPDQVCTSPLELITMGDFGGITGGCLC